MFFYWAFENRLSIISIPSTTVTKHLSKKNIISRQENQFTVNPPKNICPVGTQQKRKEQQQQQQQQQILVSFQTINLPLHKKSMMIRSQHCQETLSLTS